MKKHDIQSYIDFGNELRGAEVYFRHDWSCYYFSLLGKSFGMLTEERITLKGDPTDNIHLREKYQSVVPGYHTNKKHWNSIDLSSDEIDVTFIKILIKKSYELVLKGLPAKEKDIIDEMPVRE